MNIVIGKNSNLSNTLLEKVDDIVLVSSRDIINDIDILKIYKGNKKNIIFNNFHPANQLSGVDNYLNYMQNSITVTAIVKKNQVFNPYCIFLLMSIIKRRYACSRFTNIC